MGIGFTDSVVLYNRFGGQGMQGEYYIGTLFEQVRVELTQGVKKDQKATLPEDKAVFKAYATNFPKQYLQPMSWRVLPEEEKPDFFTVDTENKNFFVITKKQELGIDMNAPVGLIDSQNDYGGDFFQHMNKTAGNTYLIGTMKMYTAIPYIRVGGT